MTNNLPFFAASTAQNRQSFSISRDRKIWSSTTENASQILTLKMSIPWGRVTHESHQQEHSKWWSIKSKAITKSFDKPLNR